jgi:hypothetical protein
VGLVADIISVALNGGSTSDLMNKALVAARRLGDDYMSSFAMQELNGYGSTELPDFRVVRGQLYANDPYHGWKPALFKDAQLDRVEEVRFVESVAVLEDLLSSSGEHLHQSIPGELQAILRNIFKADDVEFAVRIPRSLVTECLNRSRTSILDWALQLEQNGVHGEGMTFTPREVDAASHVTNTFINNGSITGSAVQQGSSVTQHVQTSADVQVLIGLMSQILAAAESLGASAAEAKADANTVIAQLQSGKPKESILKESLESLRSILENAAGSWLASDLLPKLIPFIPAIGSMMTKLVD